MKTNKGSKPFAGGGKSLSPANLARDFGPNSALTAKCVAALFDVLRAEHPALTNGKSAFADIFRANGRMEKAMFTYARRMGVNCRQFNPHTFLFALQNYYAILLQSLVKRFPGLEKIDFSERPFSPGLWAEDAALAAELKSISTALDEYSSLRIETDACLSGDLLKALYQGLFPRPLRHHLGEYYTPDWLVRHVLDQLHYDGGSNRRLLDPACGSGTFLLMAIQRIRAAWISSRGPITSDSSKTDLLGHILSHIAGMDLNPLAVMTARANFLIAVHDLLPPAIAAEPSESLPIPIYPGDSILNLPPHDALDKEQFDLIVGNPPWIAWDNLPADYREATKPLWERYGLFSLSGKEARHGGGKKDLSMLMLYAVADRYLKTGGRLGFIITQTIFQTRGAGDGFRRFRLGDNGEYLRVQRVDDLTAVRPFGDAANWTSVVVIEKGRPTRYPAPYFKWQAVKESNRPEKIVLTPFFARPIDPDRPSSPWFLEPQGLSVGLEKLIASSDYAAHLGANTGGANGVYWLELLGKAEGGVRVRNIPQKGKNKVDVVEAVIEPDLIFPLLRWRDVASYKARPGLYILLAQDCATRTGIDEAVMREKYPLTLEYLKRFKQRLIARAAYRRYQRGRPFYSMYNVGPYTIAPIKVVWRRMDRRINAAVVTLFDDPLLGRRPVVPQETCVLIACQSLAEASYLCAVLNSSLVNFIVQAHSVQGGKGFGTPNMLEYLNLRRFDPQNPTHNELTLLGETAQQELTPQLEKKINRLVAELYGLDAVHLTTAEGIFGL